VRAAEEVILAFAERKNLYESYYTFDLVNSQEARQSWVPPDKETID
jgi:hypothetical protein